MSECNSVESADLTYYQRNRDMILEQNIIIKMIKRD